LIRGITFPPNALGYLPRTGGNENIPERVGEIARKVICIPAMGMRPEAIYHGAKKGQARRDADHEENQPRHAIGRILREN